MRIKSQAWDLAFCVAAFAVAGVVMLPLTQRTTPFSGSTSAISGTGPTPPALYEPAMAYDGATRTVIMFGGSNTVPNNYTWSWDGINWTQLHPAHSPSARQGAALAYDPAHQVLLLFGGNEYIIGDESKPSSHGGSDQSLIDSDTWSYDGTDWKQLRTGAQQRSTNSVEPAMAWDTNDQTMVLDEICPAACYGSDRSRIWTWSWEQSNWDIVPSQGKPMPWDEGGQGDWATPFVSNRTSPSFRPNGNVGFSRALAADPATGGVLFVAAGRGPEFSYSEQSPPIDYSNVENWTWSANAWHPLAVTRDIGGNSLPMPVMAPNNQGQMLLVDGWGESWIWDGSGWTKQSGRTPGVRGGAALAYDVATGQDVLFGGEPQAPNKLLADTWVWQSGGWRQVAGPIQSISVDPIPSQPDPPASLGIANCKATGNRGPFGSAVPQQGVTSTLILTRNRDFFGSSLDGNPSLGADTQPGRLVCVQLNVCRYNLPCIQFSCSLGCAGGPWSVVYFGDPIDAQWSGGGFWSGPGAPPDISGIKNLLAGSGP